MASCPHFLRTPDRLLPAITALPGSVRAQDMGFLVMAALGLMLREVQWLTCLLQLTQGPRSPHLQALHAVLKVLRAKGRGLGEENTKLRGPPGPAKLDWQVCFMGFHHVF